MTSPAHSGKVHHILYPFSLKNSEGGLYAAAQGTTNADLPADVAQLKFHSVDDAPFRMGNADVEPVAPGGPLPLDVWFRQYFLMQHLDAYTRMLGSEVAHEIYRDTSIEAEPGTIEYVVKFFEKYRPDYEADERHGKRFDVVLDDVNTGDIVSVQGPVWFIPFIRENSDALRAKGVRHVQFEHQLIPEGLDQTALGERILPCYSKADVLYFHTSVYADRLANMLQGPLPDMRTVDLGIDMKWIDDAGLRVKNLSQLPNPGALSPTQERMLTAAFRAKETVPHNFAVFDRADPMKGTHNIILGIKMFLDDARRNEGPAYRERYHFSAAHMLFEVTDYPEHSPIFQYVRVCKELYAELEKQHPGMVCASESFPAKHGHRDILPSLLRGSTVFALHGQDGLGLCALEAAYINRNEDVGLIIGDQAGCYMEADRRGYGHLVHGVEAGNPQAIAQAIKEVVLMRERAPGELAKRNAEFARGFVIPRSDTMALE